MTELLCKMFIKKQDDTSSAEVRRAYGTLVSAVGILLNLLLAIGKYTVGLLFGVISIQADAVNNFSDAGSQIISLISFKIAAKPPDREHPFGHARIEYVASMIVSFIVLMIGWQLLGDSFNKIFNPELTVFSWISVAVLAVSILVKLWLFFFNRRIAKKIDSSVMRATAADSLSDAAATAGVLASSLIYYFFKLDLDAYMGILIAILILVAGVKILNETKNSILGGMPSDEMVATIERVVSEYPAALGIHDLVVHSYGAGRCMASLHIEVDGSVNIFETHDTVDMIEKRLRDEYFIDATIHMDPIVTDDPMVNAGREKVTAVVADIDPTMHIHDFRMVPGTTHTNLIFDISVNFEFQMTDADIKNTVCRQVSLIDQSFFCVITVDRC